MKKVIFCLMMLTIAAISFSQSTGSITPLTRQDYLLKSKDEKFFSLLLFGAGATTLVLISKGNTSIEAGGILAILGTVSVIASVPLFIASVKNKKRAMKATASFDMRTMPSVQNKTFAYKSYPALSLKINL